MDIAEDVMYLNAHYDDPLMILTGDYNARTGVLDDFITIEDAVAECTGINVNDEGLYQSKHNLSDKGIEVRRFNEDKLVNNNGRLLLDFCKGLDLHIVNGRVGNDLGRGKLTCKNTSTIDYVIASPNCFQLIKDFDVDIFDSFLSDVHSPLCFTLVHMLDKNETADVEINLGVYTVVHCHCRTLS